MPRERFGNPVIGEEVTLRLFVFNANQMANLREVEKIDIYKLGDAPVTSDNPDGRRFITTISSDDITLDATGVYSTNLLLSDPLFTLGRYVDEWTVLFDECTQSTVEENFFEIKRDLWFTDVAPIVHDFEFTFQPNRMVKGSKKYITIEVQPLVPRGTDLERYYKNLITVGEVLVTIEMKCSDCLPSEKDLRIICENEPASFRDGCFAYFFMNTEELDCGLYNMQFTLNMGPNCFVSDKQQFLVFD
jgi:hypothetical protein